MPQLDKYFQAMLKLNGSDLHLSEGEPPKVRIHGKIVPLAKSRLSHDVLRHAMSEICSHDRWNHFEHTGDLDFAHAMDEPKARFRANYFRQVNGIAAIFRHIPGKIRTLEELNLPPVLETFTMLRAGLVLVTGPTGSGKSTTLAALINRINATQIRHIVTIEEPVEFVHDPMQSVIGHREVGIDVNSFADGLYTATRQDVDIILVGEMRDQETVSLALQAAARGLLVFGTLHTQSASKTIDRIIDVFPVEEQGQIRTLLADVLRGVVAQLLLRTPTGKGRVACHEILTSAAGLASSIRDGNTGNIRNIIQAGRRYGMQMMDDAIFAATRDGLVDPQDAYMKALDKNRFAQFQQ